MAETCRRQHNKVGYRHLCFDVSHPSRIAYNTTGMLHLKFKMARLCSLTRWPQPYLKSVCVAFMVGLVTLGQASLYIRRFYPISIIQPILHIRIP